MATNKIQATKNYGMFCRHDSENRPLDMRKHKKLKESMKRYGFLRSFPIVVRRQGDKLIVKDGQHRLAIAEELGLSVFWVEEEVDFDIAVINSTSRTWTLPDYAKKHAANGLAAYQEGIDFAEAHGLPLGTAFALLAGTTTFGNCEPQFIDGTFEVKDRAWAEAVVSIYNPIADMCKDLNCLRFVQTCMAVCRVPDFNPKRLLRNADRCRDMLRLYGNREGNLKMLQEVYNYGHSSKVPLAFQAEEAMKRRGIGKKSKPADPSSADSAA